MKHKKTITGLMMLIVLAGCATSPPNEFIGVNDARMITSERKFITEVVGKPLKVVNANFRADLIFNSNSTITGKIILDGLAQEINLDWEWVGEAYCRKGAVGNKTISKKCESVELYPGVGVLLKYIDSKDPDEYWVFK